MAGNVSIITRAPLAIGITALGVTCLAYNNFALQWQSAPDWIKALPGAAMISAVSLIATGIALVTPRLSRWGAISTLVLFAVWALLFHGVAALRQPDQVYVWLGVCEVAALAFAGLAILGSTLTDTIWRQRAVQTARMGFGLCAIVFGVSHFTYVDATAAMVPSWLVMPKAWAYITGAGHLAAGLALLSGVRVRLAAGLEAAMCGAFVLLLHAPRVAANPTSQMEWTMICIAVSIGGAAWIMREGSIVTSSSMIAK